MSLEQKADNVPHCPAKLEPLPFSKDPNSLDRNGTSRSENDIISAYRIKGHQYSAGPSFSAPQSITEKPMEVYYLDEWIIITLHVAGFLHPAIF